MIDKLVSLVMGPKYERDLKKLLPLLHRISERETWAMTLQEEDFPRLTENFRERLQKGESLDSLLPEAFAIAREAARRRLGERPYDVQLLGGIVLHQGKIMEMATGEGKTLSSVAAAYLNALEGKGVHVVTVNDYLAKRDAEWMGAVYAYLGLNVGVILSHMDPQARAEQYARDITYGTNNEFGFDYLRDNMVGTSERKVQKRHPFAIIDEIDSILIDEARTPLIISGSTQDDTAQFVLIDRLVPSLTECQKDPETGTYPLEDPLKKSTLEGDYKIDEKGKRVSFTDQGLNHIERILQEKKIIQGSLFEEENFEYVHYFTQALRAHRLYQKDVDYVIQEGQVQIVDEFTGRILHGRRYSEGLHQAIEAKEHIRVAQRSSTLATITFQNYFRMYDKIAGMTGTALTEAREFGKIYQLDVVTVPTNRPVVRVDDDDMIYLDKESKLKAIGDLIEEVHGKGQPILVGTISVENSETISRLLVRRGVPHEVLNAKNHGREAIIIGEAGAEGSVTIATNMAGRGTDIKLGGNPETRAKKRAGSQATPEEYQAILLEERVRWERDNQRVRELGGLYVIGTERHESRRIDNQLRGRSGRQGDPGFSQFYISLDDDLMRLFGRDRLKNTMIRLGMSGDEPLHHRFINKSLERAQKAVEERNYDIRKHLLDYDDVLGKQRDLTYQHRHEVLTHPDLAKKILEIGKDILGVLFEDYDADLREHDQTYGLARLKERLKNNFFYGIEERVGNLSSSEEERSRRIQEVLTDNIREKQDEVGRESLDRFIRYEYLRNLDERWQNHLENMEALREAVYLRSYAQKNPLVEYRKEGFDLFEQLIDDVRVIVARRVFKIIVKESTQKHSYEPNRTVRYGAPAKASLPATAAAAGEKRREEGSSVQVQRSAPKVGRNSPCPCGSGKKYKLCCGD